ncbi:MAG: efflux RND transporter periplasmic adaptor subunit [Chloroflexota bacterium]
MTRKLTWRVFVCASLIGLTSLSCTAPEPPPTPDAEATQSTDIPGGADATGASPQAKQTVAVRRGAIADSVIAAGRVGGVDEVPLTMSVASRATNVAVAQGDVVSEGQVLIATDTSAVEREINLSQARLDEANARQEKAQAAAQADAQHLNDVQQQAVAAQQQMAEDTQTKLSRAIEELNLLKAGPPADAVLAAQGAVIGAQATLQRAQSDLERAKAGPDPIDMKAAEQELTIATVAQRKAEADLEKLKAGADPLVISQLESELLSAQNVLTSAQAQYVAVTRGADPTAVTAVERQIQSIQIDLETARRIKVGDDKNAKIARSANITKLEMSLQSAQEQLDRLKAGPDPVTLQAAQRNVEIAQRAVRDAISKLQIARQGPDKLTIDGATAAVEAAKLTVERVQRKVDALKAGPPEDQLSALESTVAAAQKGVQAAEARLAEVQNPRARSLQIRDAEDRVAALQKQVDAIAQAAAATPVPVDPEGDNQELTAARQAITQEQNTLQALQKSLNDSRLVAPFSGIVSAVYVRTGDTVRPGRPSIILSRGEDTVVRIDLPDRDASRVVAGQQARVQIENVPSKFDAIVSSVVDQGGARVGLLTVTWPGDVPALGTLVSAAVQVQRKEDVLLVPQTAVRSIGSRRYVEVVDGGTSRRVDVEIGLASDGNVEIVSGLREGQTVTIGS